MPRKFDEAMRAQVRHLNALGFSDGSIARRIGCCRLKVWRCRRSMGLASHYPHSQQCKAVRKRTTQQNAEAQGLKSLSDFRCLSLRVAAARRGWPPDITAPMALAVLDALEAKGDMTRSELATAVGRSELRRSVMPALVRCGAVERVGNRGLQIIYRLAIKRRPKHTNARSCDGLSAAILGA